MKAGIVAPARKISPKETEAAMETLRSWGLIPVPGKHLYSVSNQYAGTDAQRAADLQGMLDDPEIRLILCARGGYGTVRIAGRLDFSAFLRSPKWIAGYSDITVLHSLLNGRYATESIHSPMALHFGGGQADSRGVESLRKALFGEKLEYTWPAGSLNRPGACRGILTGGNLSVLYSLRGTPFDLSVENRILFLEDLDEYLYHIDRMMVNLRLGGWLKSLKGMLVGGFSEMHDNTVPFGKNAEEILAEAFSDTKTPLSFGFPAGHQSPNMALFLGREAEMQIDEHECRLWFPG